MVKVLVRGLEFETCPERKDIGGRIKTQRCSGAKLSYRSLGTVYELLNS